MTPPPTLVDIGLNLAHDSFDHDRAQVVAARASRPACSHMVITGSTLDSTRRRDRARADRSRRLFRATAGVHPHHASELARRATCRALRELLAAPEVGAAGECGLDYFRNFSSHADQERAFRWQLRTGRRRRQAGVPAPARRSRRLRRHSPRLPAAPRRAASPTASPATARELRDYLDLGLSIGITGWICDERRGQHLRELVRQIPLDRLLVETDAPYLLPRDLRPKPAHRRNEPKYLPHVVKVIAGLPGRGLSDAWPQRRPAMR